MEKMSHLPRCAVLLTVIVCLLLSGCAASLPDFFAFRESGFSATCEGNLHGQPFRARVFVDSHDTGYRVTVEYLAPESLAGVHISAVCSQAGQATGEVTATLHGKARTLPAAAVHGLLLPATLLLEGSTPKSLCRSAQGWELKLETGASLTLSREAIPTKALSDSAEFWVVWCKNEENPKK